MRRLARPRFTLCSAMSLLLGVAACAAWVRSHWVVDTWVLESSAHSFRHVALRRGVVWYSRLSPVPSGVRITSGLPRPGHYTSDPDQFAAGPTPPRGVLGFGFERRTVLGGSHEAVGVNVPLWSACVLTSLLPAWWAGGRLRRRRHPPGLCRRCGYDLRASPERCPECGSLNASAAAAPA